MGTRRGKTVFLAIIMAAVLLAGCGRIRVTTGSDLSEQETDIHDLTEEVIGSNLLDSILPTDSGDEGIVEETENAEGEENVTEAEPEPEVHGEEMDGSEYIGVMPRTNLPEGIEEFGGWVVAYDGEDVKYVCGHYSKDGTEMIWLEELLYYEEGRAQTVVIDVLILPEIEDAYFCSSMYFDNNYSYGRAFGLVEYADTEILTNVYRVWVVDQEDGKFIEVPKEGWFGYNEGYGV